MKMSEKLKKI